MAVSNQYVAVMQLVGADATAARWMSEDDRARISSYIKYDEIYWSEDSAFKLLRRGDELNPVFVPNPRTIVDSTSHYLLKGLKIEAKSKAQDALKKILKREKFQSRFMTAKHAGVNRGDWVFHITADPDAPEGKRISMTSVHPGHYFPVPDKDDLDKIIAVHLCEVFIDPDDGKQALKRLTYREVEVDGVDRISVEENVYYLDRVWNENQPPLKREIQAERLLPESIPAIPVYHFKNMDWQGDPFGSSELRGYERLFTSVNQTLSDEELALALEGLGVYATDAGKPEDEDGNEVDWQIGPGRVVETPLGSFFKRVDGISSVTPMLDHAKYLDSKLMESSGTFLAGTVDVQVAQSGIALAIRFLPTTAKLEERDLAGVDVCQNMWHDWTFWHNEYESDEIQEGDDVVDVSVGEKLPKNRSEIITELNNLYDRKLISGQYYRDQMEQFGYVFPDDIDQQVLDEAMKKAEQAQQIFEMGGGEVGPDGKPLDNGDPKNPNAPTQAGPGNRSNNKNKVNESNGTEAKQTTRRQAGRPLGKPGR